MKLTILTGILLLVAVVKSQDDDDLDKYDDKPSLKDFEMETVCFDLMHIYRRGYRCLKSNYEIENSNVSIQNTLQDKCLGVSWNLKCFEYPEHDCRNGIWISGLLHMNQLILDDPAMENHENCSLAKTELQKYTDSPSPECTKMYKAISVCDSAFMETNVRAFGKFLKIDSIFQFSPILDRPYVCGTFRNIDQDKLKKCYEDAEVNRCFAGKSKDKPTEILERVEEYCISDCQDFDERMNRLANCPFGLPDEVSAMLLLLNNSKVPENLMKYEKGGFDCQPIQRYIDETGDCVNENIGNCETLAFLMRRVGQFIRSSAISRPVPLLRKAVTQCKIQLPFDFYSHGYRECANLWLIISAAFVLVNVMYQ